MTIASAPRLEGFRAGHVKSWIKWGTFYGYPSCCIKSFCTLEHVGMPPRKLSGTGYIPCLVCNGLSEQELIDNINAARSPCVEPFKALDQ